MDGGVEALSLFLAAGDAFNLEAPLLECGALLFGESVPLINANDAGPRSCQRPEALSITWSPIPRRCNPVATVRRISCIRHAASGLPLSSAAAASIDRLAFDQPERPLPLVVNTYSPTAAAR